MSWLSNIFSSGPKVDLAELVKMVRRSLMFAQNRNLPADISAVR